MTFQSSSYGSLELTLDLDTLPIVAIRNATLRATAFWQLGSIMTQHIEENAHLQALLAAAVDAVITIDRLGIIQSCNPAAERIFGYSKDELLGQNISILMPSPFREEHDGYLANYAKTGDARIIGIGREAEAMRKDGSVFPADIAVSEFTTGNERFLLVLFAISPN